MSVYLLDTHTFLWLLDDDPRLTTRVKTIFLDPDNQLLLSDVSSWEMAIKSSLGKLSLPTSAAAFIPTQLRQNGIDAHPITLGQVLAVESLPLHHRDPFDRLLAVQALEGLTLLSRDKVFDLYGVLRVWD
ncbi:MAG: type II toxin-antitoxin system VapC family toxin [Vulcanimicrobiota bacterium]